MAVKLSLVAGAANAYWNRHHLDPRSPARLGERDHLLLHRCCRVSDCNALEQILSQKCFEAAKALILSGMTKFMHPKAAITTTIGANKDTVLKCKPAGEWRDQLRRRGRLSK